MQTGFRSAGLLVLMGACSAGCRLPGVEGPVSKSLATSRQYSQQGVAAIEAGRWVEAQDVLAKAVKSCPTDPEARRHHAEALWHIGQQAKAVGELEEAIAMVGDDVSLHVRLAEMRLAMGQLDPAAREAEAALDLDPQPQKSLSMLQSLIDTYAPGEEPQRVVYLQALAYQAMGRHEDAADGFALALARGEATPELLYRLAESQSRVGRQSEAAAAAEKALALDPGHQPSRLLLGRLGIARRANDPTPR
ncbi:MAG: tetratricopeptide repeat protein [Planctomycetia bacterium]|nr:tetratricopeptide repeat protein [Planctomycetia bacterium]